VWWREERRGGSTFSTGERGESEVSDSEGGVVWRGEERRQHLLLLRLRPLVPVSLIRALVLLVRWLRLPPSLLLLHAVLKRREHPLLLVQRDLSLLLHEALFLLDDAALACLAAPGLE
jgi:hypothetical protein